MRTVSAPSLAKLNQKLGTEPANIIEIDWGGGSPISYADKDVPGTNIPGKILELGEIDNIVDIFNSNSSQELAMRLSDTDGTIKTIFNNQEIHEVSLRAYQWYDGLDVDEKFLVFAGKVSSPINWKEADRSFSFSAVSEVEDREFGYSAEEGQHPFLPAELVGKAWPVVYGKELDVPALQINKAVTGSTLCPVGILSGEAEHRAASIGGDDCGLAMSILMISEQISFLNVVSSAWLNKNPERSNQLFDQANELRVQLANATGSRNQQLACANSKRQETIDTANGDGLGCNPVRILGGEDFEQNEPMTLDINGGLFTGSFIPDPNQGETRTDRFSISFRRHPANDSKATDRSTVVENSICSTTTPPQFFDFAMDVPNGTGDFSGAGGTQIPILDGNGNQIGSKLVREPDSIRRRGFIICTRPHTSRPLATNILQHFWADAGSRVTVSGDEPISFIASITPGTVLQVQAFKTFNGEKTLVLVPESFYSVSVGDFGTVQATLVTTFKPLSTIEGQGWEDQIYVTFESTIGPNPVDILEHIITNYTSLTFDTASFDVVKALLANTGSGGDVLGNNMAILDRVNTLDLIKDVAFLNRCAVWVNNGVFYLKYLPIEPVSDLTITTSDFRFKSVEVNTNDTEALSTKFVAEWRLAESEEKPQKITQRGNVDKYGIKELTIDWFTHNQPDIIHKALTFWMIRMSNSWKEITFDGFMHLIQLETWDTVTLDLPDYVANGPVKAIVKEARYDSSRRSVRVTCLVPVRTGEMTVYPLFWPSDKLDITFPRPGDETHAGGNGIGADATGALPIGDTSGLLAGGGIFIGGPNVIFGPQADHGDSEPWDTGFAPSDIILDGVFADVDATQNPEPDLDLNFVDPFPGMERPDIGSTNETAIDIRTTRIIDSNNSDAVSTLDTVFKQIFQGILQINTGAFFNDGTNTGTFDFKWDAADTEFGAGTGFLE